MDRRLIEVRWEGYNELPMLQARVDVPMEPRLLARHADLEEGKKVERKSDFGLCPLLPSPSPYGAECGVELMAGLGLEKGGSVNGTGRGRIKVR